MDALESAMMFGTSTRLLPLFAVASFGVGAVCVGCGPTSATPGPVIPVGGDAQASSPSATELARLVSLDGTTTELLYALGLGDRLVGRDGASIYPPAVESVRRLGTGHDVSAEAVYSVNPTLVLMTESPRRSALLEQLRGGGVPVVSIVPAATPAEALARFRQLGDTLGVAARAEELARSIERDLASLASMREDARREGTEPTSPATHSIASPRVLPLYLRGAQHQFILGRGHALLELVELAGGVPALPEVGTHQALNREALIASQPDVLIVLKRGLDSVGGLSALLALEGIDLTPAGQRRRVIVLDDGLVSFGPRFARAALELNTALLATHGPSWILEDTTGLAPLHRGEEPQPRD